jgi:hypothetical protein
MKERAVESRRERGGQRLCVFIGTANKALRLKLRLSKGGDSKGSRPKG